MHRAEILSWDNQAELEKLQVNFLKWALGLDKRSILNWSKQREILGGSRKESTKVILHEYLREVELREKQGKRK